MVLNEAPDGDAVRHVGADHHGVGGADGVAMLLEPGKVGIEHEAAPIRVGQVAMRRVPGHVAL